jgi:hypothetical protein
MALIKCPRCGNKISERANQCPWCGATKQEIKQVQQKRQESEHTALMKRIEEEAKRIQAERDRAEADALEADIKEWWEKNKKKVYVILAIVIGVIIGVKVLL